MSYTELGRFGITILLTSLFLGNTLPKVLFFRELKEGRKDKLKGPQMQIFSQNPTGGNDNDDCSVIKIDVDILTSTEAEDLKYSTL